MDTTKWTFNKSFPLPRNVFTMGKYQNSLLIYNSSLSNTGHYYCYGKDPEKRTYYYAQVYVVVYSKFSRLHVVIKVFWGTLLFTV